METIFDYGLFSFLLKLKNKCIHISIFSKQVQDLLNPSSARDSLPVRWARDRGFYVENLFFVECDMVDDLSAVLEEGMLGGNVLFFMFTEFEATLNGRELINSVS